jgi:hypothetical protein
VGRDGLIMRNRDTYKVSPVERIAGQLKIDESGELYTIEGLEVEMIPQVRSRGWCNIRIRN